MGTPAKTLKQAALRYSIFIAWVSHTKRRK